MDTVDKATAWDEISKKNDEIARLRQFVDFVNLWCWRETAISDTERLSMIKHHPTAKAALKTS